MKLFRWANIFIWPQHYDIFLYLVEMPKIPNFLHLREQITSGALHVPKFWSRERRLFAWQIKPHNFYLGTVYIAHREVKDLPRFQGHLENRTSYDTRLVINCQRLAPLVWPRLAESKLNLRQLLAVESYTESQRTLVVTADVSSMYGFTGKPYFLVCRENRKNSKQMGPVEVIEDRCVV